MKWTLNEQGFVDNAYWKILEPRDSWKLWETDFRSVSTWASRFPRKSEKIGSDKVEPANNSLAPAWNIGKVSEMHAKQSWVNKWSKRIIYEPTTYSQCHRSFRALSLDVSLSGSFHAFFSLEYAYRAPHSCPFNYGTICFTLSVQPYPYDASQLFAQYPLSP